MGHEIAHAVAKHSVERMSAAMAINVLLKLLIFLLVEKCHKQEIL